MDPPMQAPSLPTAGSHARSNHAHRLLARHHVFRFARSEVRSIFCRNMRNVDANDFGSFFAYYLTFQWSHPSPFQPLQELLYRFERILYPRN